MIHHVEDISIFNPSGELNPSDGVDLLRKIQNYLAGERSKIVLNLRDVEHIHYRFLSELLSLAAVSSLLAGGIKIAHATRYHRDIMRLTGVEECFETYDSVADAILSFQDPFARTCLLH